LMTFIAVRHNKWGFLPPKTKSRKKTAAKGRAISGQGASETEPRPPC